MGKIYERQSEAPNYEESLDPKSSELGQLLREYGIHPELCSAIAEQPHHEAYAIAWMTLHQHGVNAGQALEDYPLPEAPDAPPVD